MNRRTEAKNHLPRKDSADASGQRPHRRRMKIFAVGMVLLAGLAVYFVLQSTGLTEILLDGAALRDLIGNLGVWGPLAVIALLALAILVSPLPSAPVAVAAGAAYGHFWGTVYVLAGAEIGALAAFTVARLLGYEIIQNWFGERMRTGLLGSQNALMGFVFVSRLLPFISFDVISYAAGLSVLSLWRFALATLAGIVPMSFLLAHFGDEISSGNSREIMISVVLLGAVTAIPLAADVVRRRFRHGQKQKVDNRGA